MILGVNHLANFTTAFWFENGWSINISKTHCGHLEIVIIPRHIHENADAGDKEIRDNLAHYTYDAMRKRGDYIEHFEGDDAELLNIIIDVKFRDQEPSLKKISQDIMKAVKS